MPSTKPNSLTVSLTLLSLIVMPATAQQWGSGQGGYPGGGSSSYGGSGQGDAGAAMAKSIKQKHQMLAAHATMACLAWVFLVPLGGILLRLNIRSPWTLRAHGVLQVTSYVAYITAVGLGMYLAESLEFTRIKFYKDPHTMIGLTILAIGFFEPILGFIHHRIFRKNVIAHSAGQENKKPGRTLPGNTHVWLGRACIFFGMINGGLGIRLTKRIGFQSKEVSRSAMIGYVIGALVMFSAYVVIVGKSEIRKARNATNADKEAQHVREYKSALVTVHSASEQSL